MTTSPIDPEIADQNMCPYTEDRNDNIYRCVLRNQHYGDHNPVPTGKKPERCPNCNRKIMRREDVLNNNRCIHCGPEFVMADQSVTQEESP